MNMSRSFFLFAGATLALTASVFSGPALAQDTIRIGAPRG